MKRIIIITVVVLAAAALVIAALHLGPSVVGAVQSMHGM